MSNFTLNPGNVITTDNFTC